ncbi:MAG: hypothetical protein CMN90_08775 [Sutterellaceae bacterium]|nr:hypothetical protein [Sutterellaceae bacterium]|tara:strand:+ start:6948 stop:10220 length:3273 start_codon:yes stop_codon:yes gene_type:complete
MINPARLEKLGNCFSKLGTSPSQKPCVLMLSSSNGLERAQVETFVGQSFETGWKALCSHASASFDKTGVDYAHVRVDRVCEVKRTNWAALKVLLSTTKRNYFSYGIALDPQFEYSFLWGELNGNAMLYGGSEEEFSKLNVGNFEKYARKKYGQSFALNHDDEQPVYLFLTQGAYIGTDEIVHHLEEDGVAVGRRQLPDLDVQSSSELVLNASEFLARQVKDNGFFVYGLFPCFNKEIPTYNTLRHASSTYAMIEAWEVTQSAFLKSAIDRSLHCLTNELIKQIELSGGIQAAFLVDTGNEIKLGGNAVSILALAKYTELTGTREYIELMEKLAQGIVAMLNPDTRQFVHVLNYPDLTVKEQFRIIYYDGEAAFALMRLYKITRRARWLQAVELAFEYFIAARHWKANDHWMSYCVNELTLYRPKREYFEFGIRNFSNHLDFVLTRITTFPTLLELMMAAQQMLSRLQAMPEFADLYLQVDTEKFYRALHWRANYLTTGYFWPEWAMYFAKPDTLNGSFFIRHHAYRVRIDDVEHYVSGLVAYRKFLIQGELNQAQETARPNTLLNAKAEETTFWFLNQNFGFQRSGVENAALLRYRVFDQEMQLKPVLLTCRYNPRLHESIDKLVANKALPASSQCRSVYDYFQNAEVVSRQLNTGQSFFDNPMLRCQLLTDRRDIRVMSQHGQLLMYVVRNPVNDALIHINHFSEGVKFRKDYYDSRGFLSCVQYLDAGGTVSHEHYLRPDGTLAIAKLYKRIDQKSQLSNIRLHDSTGVLVACLFSESEWLTFALVSMLKAKGGKHVLVVDKNRYWYLPAIAARDQLHQESSGQVAVVPVIHALHTQTVDNLATSPTNSNFRDILHDIKRPDAIITLTNQQMNDISSRYGNGQLFPIAHSCEVKDSIPDFETRDRFRIVSMARYSPEKNHHLAIAAFAKVVKKYPQARLDFYGFAVAGSSLLSDLKAQVESLGLQNHIGLNDWTDAPATHYLRAGLSLLTSQAEAYSLAIMESLCHACPAIAFDVPYGPSHLIVQGETGLLAPFGDTEALAEQIISVFDDNEFHKRMSGKAFALANRFSHAEAARHWRQLFSAVGVLS